MSAASSGTTSSAARYTADLPLWHELAAAAPGPVLDVGAGTGRVALHLARAGLEVTALDIDAELLAELERRAATPGCDVETVVADAGGLRPHAASGSSRCRCRRSSCCARPRRLLRLRAARHRARRAGRAGDRRRAGGVRRRAARCRRPTSPRRRRLALRLPADRRAARSGARRGSSACATRSGPTGAAAPRTTRSSSPPSAPASSRPRARPPGCSAEPARTIAPTPEHVGSEVVLLRG